MQDISTTDKTEALSAASYLAKSARLAKYAALAALVALGLSLLCKKIIDTDIWWHLSAGKFIVGNHVIPATDMFSYTAGGNKWIDLHWLFQVIVYLVYSTLGGYGLSLLFITVFSVAFAISWKASRRENNFLPAIFFFWLAIMAGNSRFLARPEAFTYLIISIYILLLHGFEQGRFGRWIFALIPLQVIWTNMQGLFILGPFLVFAFTAQAVLAYISAYLLKREKCPEERTRMIKLLVTAFGTTAACLVNPYGLEGLLFPIILFTRAGGMKNIFASSISELQPPFSGYNLTSPLVYFGFFIALCALVVLLDWKNIKLSHLIVFAGTGYLGLNARRNVPVFIFAFLPLAVEHAGNVLTRMRHLREAKYGGFLPKLAVPAYGLLFVVMLLQIFNVWSNKYYIADKRAERMGLGFREKSFPQGAFAFLKENKVEGPFLNSLDIGGMFMWAMYPTEKVFIDPRLEVNSAETFFEYRQAMSDAKALVALTYKYGFNAAIVSHSSQNLYLTAIMYFLPGWELVYLDPVSAVFLRRVPRNEKIIEVNRIDMARDPVRLDSGNGEANGSSPRILKGIANAIASLTASDDEAQNRFSLGLVFLVLSKYDRAVEELEAGLSLMPSLPEGYYNLGLAYDRMGRKDEAEECYKKTINLDPRHSMAHANLGKIYDERGQKRKAEEEYRLAIKVNRNEPIPLYNLGLLYYEQGDVEAARKYWQRALEVNPFFKPASEALKKTQ